MSDSDDEKINLDYSKPDLSNEESMMSSNQNNNLDPDDIKIIVPESVNFTQDTGLKIPIPETDPDDGPKRGSKMFTHMTRPLQDALDANNSVSSSVKNDVEGLISGTYTERRLIETLSRAQTQGKRKRIKLLDISF